MFHDKQLINRMITNRKEYKKAYLVQMLTVQRDVIEILEKHLSDRRRLDEIKSEKNKIAETQAEQAQEDSFQTKSITVTPSQHPSTSPWCESPDGAWGELVEQGTSGNIQEVESSLHGLRSPCERG